MNNSTRISMMIQIANWIGSLPWLIVVLIGGIVCLNMMSRRPRESCLVGGAILLAMFASLGLPILINLTVPTLNSLIPNSSSWLIPIVQAFPYAIVQSVVWVLILMAAFGEGSGPQPKYLVEDDELDVE